MNVTGDEALAHPLLRGLLGSWEGRETIRPAPWDPAGGAALTLVEAVPALGGAALQQTYTQVRAGGVAMRGLGIFRVDASSGTVALHWFDTLAYVPRLFEGREEEGRWVLVSRAERGMARVAYRLGGDGYAYALESSPDGLEWTPYLEGEYRRAGGR